MQADDLIVQQLGECRFHSPMQGVIFTDVAESVLYHNQYQDLQPYVEEGSVPPSFQVAGPREKNFF